MRRKGEHAALNNSRYVCIHPVAQGELTGVVHIDVILREQGGGSTHVTHLV